MNDINVKELDAFFCKFFEVSFKDLKEIKRGKSFEWDSMKHVDLLLSLEENFNITSLSVSVELSQPIKGLIEVSLVTNSKTHFLSLPLPDCIAVLVGM